MKPDIYYFNPTCEMAVANGSENYMAPAGLIRFENELSTLPGILARPKDVVLVKTRPPQQFTDQLNNAGIMLPDYQNMEQLTEDPLWLTNGADRLFPWGWSPAVHKLFIPLKTKCSSEFLQSPVAIWREIHRELYSRKSARLILEQIVKQSKLSCLPDFHDLPEICHSHEQIKMLQNKWGKVVVKSPWSSSGRGLQILRHNEYNQTNFQVIGGFLKQQGIVIAEPWHNKLLDLSFQFFSHGNGKIDFMGLTTFKTDQAGRYEGNFIEELPSGLCPEISEFLEKYIDDIRIEIQGVLTSSRYSTDYYGWLGVDTLIFEAENGHLKINPCLEINCRFTMGALSVKLRNHLAEGSRGEFIIMHNKAGYYADYCKSMAIKKPLILEKGKISDGFLPLTPALPANSFGAFLKVTKTEPD